MDIDELTILRPKDLLCLYYEFKNLKINTSKKCLIRKNAKYPAYVKVQFLPQNIVEFGFCDDILLFCWDGIPGKDEEKLKESIKQGYSIIGSEVGSSIDRIDDKTIRGSITTIIKKEKKTEINFVSFSLKLDKTGSEVTVYIDGQERSRKLIARNEYGKLNIYYKSDDNKPPQPPAGAIMSGTSRLVFRVPDNIIEIPFTENDLLNWSEWEPALSPNALAPGEKPSDLNSWPGIKEPDEWETSIEMPYRLIISPDRYAIWDHSLGEVTHNKRTELWHTSLKFKWLNKNLEILKDYQPKRIRQHFIGNDIISEWTIPNIFFAKEKATVRAVYSKPDKLDTDRMMFLVDQKRDLIVDACSNFKIWDEQKNMYYNPRPILIERLMLTSQGGWMDSLGKWDKDNPIGIEEWRYIATQGRDHYSRVVEKGYLYPFGNKVVSITTIERDILDIKEDASLPTTPLAYLHKKSILVLLEPEKSFNGSQMPLKSIKILNISTLQIDSPSYIGNTNSFWINACGKPFSFNISAVDAEGHTIDFSTNMIFVHKNDNNKDSLDLISIDYKNKESLRKCALRGQSMAFAADQNHAGRTTLLVKELYFEHENSNPVFLPKMDHAFVRFPSVEKIIGERDASKVVLWEKDNRNKENPHNIFLVLEGKPLQLSFSSDKSGGLATPNMDMTAFSLTQGPLAGKPEDLSGGKGAKLSYEQILPDACLLGGIKIWEILAEGAGISTQLPVIIQNKTYQDSSDPYNGKLDEIMSWVPTLKSSGLFKRENGTCMVIKVLKNKPTNPSLFRTTGILVNFSINFGNVIELKFKSLKFESESGKKTIVSAEIISAKFIGQLEFINVLQEMIPEGLSGGASLDVSPDGVTVGYSLTLPTVSFGVFTLKNICISSCLTLPFTNAPAGFDFAFADRDHPFLISVSLLGGGGFLKLAVNTSGVKTVEGALEFGGNLSFNLAGLATGSVYIMAGIYFKRDEIEGSIIEGYVRCGGFLTVLGLISISAEFELKLIYDNGNVKGSATLTVKVEVLFFSKSVDLSVEYEFQGQKGQGMKSFDRFAADESFAAMMTRNDWADYAEAFA